MDTQETYIHSFLRLNSWKKLKTEGFYKNFSPVDSFTKEYEIQYLHYSSYYKLYSARIHLNKIKVIKKSGIRFENHFSNFIQDIFSVCDLLAGQIFITYFNESIMENKYNINLHFLRNCSYMGNGTRRYRIFYQKYQNLPLINRRGYNRIYIKKLAKLINPKNKSWYNDLKYYRNNIMHGILRFKGESKGQIFLLKRDKFEKYFDFIVKNIPIHNKKQTKAIKQRLAKMLREDSVKQQCDDYYNNVVHLADYIWQEMLHFYLSSPAQNGVKLPFVTD